MTLTEFLLARIAEDEAIAVTVQAKANRGDGAAWIVTGMDNWTADYDPARVLAECEAKRRIVARGASECGGHEDQEQFGSHHYPDPEWSHCDGCAAAESSDREWTWTLRVLAMPYADHPDYRQAWAV